MTQDPDTLDTWFSSGQWPFATLDYPEGDDFKTYYPTDVMETAADILFFWVTRMIMLGIYRTGTVPFKNVYLHGLVRDAKGLKMSKSKGNVISPLEVTALYGTDALRMGLVVGNTPGTDLNLDPQKVGAYKKFANKLWNVARFVLENAEGAGDVPETALIDEFQVLAQDVTSDLENFRYHLASEKLYHYVWDRFAAEILEESKTIFQGTDESATASRKAALIAILRGAVTLLHPFMPFVTEEIYQSLPGEKAEYLMIDSWPVR